MGKDGKFYVLSEQLSSVKCIYTVGKQISRNVSFLQNWKSMPIKQLPTPLSPWQPSFYFVFMNSTILETSYKESDRFVLLCFAYFT